MKRFVIMAVSMISLFVWASPGNASFFDDFSGGLNGTVWRTSGSVSGGVWQGSWLESWADMSSTHELVQAAIRFPQAAHAGNWSVPLGLETFTNGGTNGPLTPEAEFLVWGDDTIGAYVQIRWLNSGEDQYTYWYGYNDDGFDPTKWTVYAILPTTTGVNFYIKDGNQPFDPCNLPAPVYTVTTTHAAGLQYLTWAANEYQYGNNPQVDWVQVGKKAAALVCADLWANEQGISADINHDCYVDMRDLAVFAQSWLKCNNPTDSNCH